VSSTPWIWSHECDFDSDMAVAHSVIQDVLQQLARMNWTSQDRFAVEMALEEAFANAIHHGNHDDPLKKVFFSCQISAGLIRIQIEDEGVGFNPTSVPDPREPDNLERTCGRGVFLILNFMTHVSYSECGRRIIMEKDISKPDDGHNAREA